MGKEIFVKENDIAPVFRRFISIIPMDILEKMENGLMKGKNSLAIQAALEDICNEKTRRQLKLERSAGGSEI